MKLEVNIQSLYKWATIDEVYSIDIADQDVLDYFGANTLDEIDEHELGQLALNGYGELTSKSIVNLNTCKEDTITAVRILDET